MKIIKKIIFYFVIFVLFSFLFWIGYLFRSGPDATILMYHSIGEETNEKTTLSVSEATFEKQMKFISEHNYHVISLLNLAGKIARKEKIAPKTIVITFDDGYENNYTKAFPILKKYKLPATMFLITDFLGKEAEIYGHSFKFMTKDMVRAMRDSGLISFGAHTKNHVYLPGIKDEKVLDEEIIGSKKHLENILGRPVYEFCYPKGGYTRDIERRLRNAGYLVAVTTRPKKLFIRGDLFALARIKITEKSKNLFVFFVETSGYFLKMKELNS